MLRRTVVALLTALVAVPITYLAVAQRAQATAPGSNGKIVFGVTQNGYSQIYSVKPDGTELVKLTTSGGVAPAWSPDGSKIAFTGGDPFGIYVMNADGSSAHSVATPSGLSSFGLSWSGDGSKLAYVAYAPNNTSDIWTVNVDGTHATDVISDGEVNLFPTWSPDGTKFVYQRLNGQGGGIFAANADGSNKVRLTTETTAGYDNGPAFSPDGTKIVFARGSQIWTMNSDGTGQTQLTDVGGSSPTFPRFSPDGTSIVVGLAAGDPDGSVALMNADGSSLHTIPATAGNNLFADWQPLAQPPPSSTTTSSSTTTTTAPVATTSSTSTTTVPPTTTSSSTSTTTTLAPTTTTTQPPSPPHSNGGFILDDWGGIHSFNTGSHAPPAITQPAPYWPGQDVVRGIASMSGGGYIVDDWGGIHPYTSGQAAMPSTHDGPYWQGQDVVRGIALLPNGTGGYVLDAWGGLHPFGVGANAAPPVPQGGPYWSGVDAARGVTLLPDASGGYVVDSWGGLHPFAMPGHAMPAQPTDGPYWAGQNVVRGVAADVEGNGGYVLDDWGGAHTFSIPNTTGPVPAPRGGPYWASQDVTRGISVVP